MFDKHLREVKESVMVPVALQFGERIHPTAISIAGGAIGIAAGVCACAGFCALGLVLWLVNRVFDGLDGAVARVFGRQSDLGAYVDVVIDDAIYAFIPIMLVLGNPSPAAFIALAFLLGTFYVNSASWMYLSSILERRRQGASTRKEMTAVTMPPGIIEGAETVVFYAAFFMFKSLMVPLFVLMGVLVLVTVAQRLHWAINHLD